MVGVWWRKSLYLFVQLALQAGNSEVEKTVRNELHSRDECLSLLVSNNGCHLTVKSVFCCSQSPILGTGCIQCLIKWVLRAKNSQWPNFRCFVISCRQRDCVIDKLKFFFVFPQRCFLKKCKSDYSLLVLVRIPAILRICRTGRTFVLFIVFSKTTCWIAAILCSLRRLWCKHSNKTCAFSVVSFFMKWFDLFFYVSLSHFRAKTAVLFAVFLG